jgi:Protein of unknown function (DUF3054)
MRHAERATTRLLCMRDPIRPRVAPIVDAACIVAFVLLGRGQHGIHQGVGWFVTVVWPFVVGWFGVALVTRLYTRHTGVWRALTVTWLGGIAVMVGLRGTFTDRPYVSTFTIIALVFLGLTTFGWRSIATVISRRRGRSGASSTTAG